MSKDRRGLRKGNKSTKRMLALLLALAMVITSVPNMGLTTHAANTGDTRITDNSTIDNWKRYFGDDVKNTINAGGIWTDKSVFKNADELSPVKMNDSDNNFLVAMSAIAANKSITGYSTIPTDTMLVLDLSGSMVDNTATPNQNDTTDTRVETMVAATNNAIKKLLDLNKNNRVGVVLYSGNANFGTSNTGTATLLLPLDRYAVDSKYLDNTGTLYKENDFLQVYTNNGIRVRVAQGRATWGSDEEVMVKNDDGNFVTAQNKRATGGTYTQNGMYLAWKEFEKVEDTVIQDSFQAGTKRMPVMVLMSDGAPTTATTSFHNVGTSNVGNGAGSCATDSVGFLTQLTAAWTRSSMQSHYNNTPKIYTLGYGLDALASGQEVAESVLNPGNSTTDIDNLWRNYISATGNALTIHNAPGTSSNQNGNSGSQTIQVSKNARITSVEQQNYVDQYFEASSESQLTQAFEDIVEQIILQSKYYPTEAENDKHNLGGYISFEDDLGHFMEVKDLKGLLLGNTLYDGARMAQAIIGGELGTAANPTKMGDEFIFSVVERLGLESNAAARELVRQAWLAGQLSYTDKDEYSNYIGWYADKDNKYLGFWSENHTAEDVPANAVYTMKSYGYMGYDKITEEESIKDSDLMYMTVRIQTEITTGNQSVHWSIPASLIPTVTYKVEMEGKNYEEAAQLDKIEVEIQKANPVRLVYEVGLVDEINELTVADIMAQEEHVHTAPDGSYYFYTNMWGDTDDDGQTNIDYADPYTHVVTTVDYEPSIENERYYYTEDSTVYVKNGENYNPINYDPKNVEGTYYHGRKVFVYDETAQKWNIETYYEEITKESLAKATKYTDKNQWYIPAGTILRYNEQFRLDKGENKTGTLQYVTYPFIYNPNPETDENYHSDVFLGNNGRITITPATGIKLTKTVDAVAPGTQTNNFNFEIKLDAPSGTTLAASYPAVIFDADGNQVGNTFNIVVNANGKMDTITLADGQTIYIKDLPAGTGYEIVENAHTEYVLKSINGNENADKAEGTIQDKVLESIEFLNTLKTHGSLIISKTVSHPLGDNYIIPDGIEFTVNVDLDGAGVANAELEIIRVANSGKITVDAEGKFSFKIKPSEAIAINNIPSGTKYTISETDLPKGFALNTAESTALEGTILTDVNATERLLNEYNPDNAAPVNITLEGTKTVEGRKWLDTDSFSFELQKYQSGQWVTVGTQKSVSASNKSFNFTSEMRKEVFDAVGTYQYRVIEVEGTIGGITYDKAIRYFDVNVTDKDMDGELEIAATDGVHATAPTKVNTEMVDGATVYHIVTDFTNKYAPIGSAQFEINIQKTIANTTGVDIALSDFSFEVHEATVSGNNWEIVKKVTESTKTNALGEAVVGMVYEPNDLTEADGLGGTTRIEERTYHYILKEKVPDDKIKGMYYTDKEYKVTVLLKDNLDGTMSTVVSVDGVLDTETSNSARADFENVFDLGETTASLKASKKLTGRDMTAGEFSFGLYEADDQFRIGNMIGKASNGAAKADAISQFAFEPVQGYDTKFDKNNNLVFKAVGTYHYIVREIIPQQIEHNGIQYDTTEYNVIITITDNGNGGLTSQIALENATYSDEAILFTNIYSATGVTEDFQGSKTLENRTQIVGEFSFELYETKSDYKTDGLTPIEVKRNTSTGAFAFSPIAYDKVGTYYYVIQENIPADTDSNTTDGVIDGVTYDKTIYEIVVVVTDNGEGELQTETRVNNQVDGLITFTNIYNVAPVEVPITLSKTLTGRNMAADEFTFQLIDANNKVVKEIKNGAAAAGTASTVTFDSLQFDSTGVYKYTVKEVLPNENDRLGGVVYDRTEYDVEITVTDDGKGQLQAAVKVDSTENKAITFTNAYAASGTSTVISATKTLIGRDLADGEFFFDLHDSAGRIIQSKGNAPTGEVVFDAIIYDKVGEHVYTLSERNTGKAGITYDSTVYTITVNVTDEGKGQLKATQSIVVKGTTQPVNAMTFENYDPVDAEVEIKGTKELTGRRLRANEFTFELYNAEFTGGKVVPVGKAIDTDQNIAAGTFGFDKITYNTEGTHYYVVKEVVPEDTDDNKTDGIINGVTYDDSVYYIKVDVTDNHAGKLNAATTISKSDNLSGELNEIQFNNTYEAADGSVRITGVKKILDGRDLLRGEFEFQLIFVKAEDVSGTLKYQPGEVIETAVNGRVWDKTNKQYVNAGEIDQVVFDDLVYEHGEEGKYTYKIVEDDSKNLGGITYSQEEYFVTIEVTNDGAGKMVVSTPVITDANGGLAVPEFKNAYTANPVDLRIEATKNLVGKDLHKDDYSFNLHLVEAPTGSELGANWVDKTAKNGNVVGATMKEISFETLSLDKAGTYKFEISEVIPSDAASNNNVKDGVTYDDTVYMVTIDVRDNGQGALVAGRPVYTDISGNPATPIFTNDYQVAPKDGLVIGVEKVLTGRDMTAGEFKFQLVDKYGQVVATGKNEAASDGEAAAVVFDEIEYTAKGTYQYTVEEVKGSLGGVKYSEAKYKVTVEVTDNGDGTLTVGDAVFADMNNDIVKPVFENTYTVTKNAKAVVGVTKVLTGRDMAAGEFKFHLLDKDEKVVAKGENVIAKDGKAAAVVFDEIEYSAKGTYKYTVVEVEENLGGVEYSKAKYQVTVKVTDNGDGTLTVGDATFKDIDGKDAEPVFTNKYTVKPTTGTVVGVTKVLTGRDMAANEFEFELLDENGKVVAKGKNKAAKNGESAKVVFDEIKYDAKGTYKYTVVEVKGKLNGVVYSEAKYNVTVEVADNGDGTLNAGDAVFTALDGKVTTPVFTNAYTVPNIVAEKTQSAGGEPTANTIEATAGKEVTYYIKVTNNGTAVAKDIVIEDKVPAGLEIVKDSITGGKKSVVSKEGIISWTIDELEAGKSEVVSFKVVIPVVEKDTTWENIATVVYGNNPEGKDVPEDSNKVVITSKMASPVTGDNTSATLWFGLAVVSMVSVAVVVDKKRKSAKEE